MKTTTILNSWMPEYNYRLDTKPYVGGVLETKLLLRKLKNTVPLHSLTSGVDGGIYNGPQFVRNYVESPEHGVPFMTGSSMQLTDLSNLPLLSKRDAHNPKLAYLEIQPGMTLISCSGTIGKMAYARPEMKGVWSSQDVLKIVADPDKIRSGYLYAYLSSKFGIPMLVSGTYGSIIQHLEPHQIADLPVPRLGGTLEHEIHELVEQAANLLSEQSAELAAATNLFFNSVGLRDITSVEWHANQSKDLGFKSVFPFPYSIRSMNFAPRFGELCSAIKSGNWKELGVICNPGKLGRGGRYNRVDSDPSFGYMLVSQRGLFALRPDGRWIARNSVGPDVLLEAGTIAVAARGTLGQGELYCRAQFVWGPWTEFAYSEDILRIVADESKMLRGCLFAFMRSETAFRMLRAISSGSKLQDHHQYFLPRLPIPMPSRQNQERIQGMVVSAIEKRHLAVANEDKAIALVEKCIASRRN